MNTATTNARWWVVLVLLSFVAMGSPVDAADFATVAEQSNYRRTATYEETTRYFERLDSASTWVKVTTYGTSPQGRSMHLVVISRDGAFTPQTARQTGKLTVLIQNGIHAGEIDGKDACMALARDMVIERTHADLLDRLTVLIIPMFNLDGHENRVRFTRPNQDGPDNAGFRATAQLFNLNRDYLKADTPEMRAWIANWRRWMPDFFIDDHVTDGADWQYTVTYTMPWHPNAAPSIRAWTDKYFDPYVTEQVERAGYKIFPYISPRRGGLTSGVSTFVDIPRFSTGYTALWNRPGLLVEMHSLKDYRTRVRCNYTMLVATLEAVARNAAPLRRAIAVADSTTTAGLSGPYPLTFEPDGDSVMVDFAGYEFDTMLSAASGGTYFRYHRDRPRTFRIPFYRSFRGKDVVAPPRAYLIPREWRDPIARLRLHGVRLDTLIRPLTATVEQYRLDSVEWATPSYEGHVRPRFRATVHETTITYPTGTVVVDLHQGAAKVAIQALEPKGPDSFVAWGLWNTIFERKEYIESYVIDPLADSMLAVDPALKAEFVAKLRDEPDFAGSVHRRRMFFYERSGFAEATLGLYPVTRLLDSLPPVAPWSE